MVAGGGAVEAALSVYLEYLATTLGSREQLAIAEFAESLLIIPQRSGIFIRRLDSFPLGNYIVDTSGFYPNRFLL